MAFYDWLLALAMFSRSPILCLVSRLRSFSWLDSISLCGWTTFVYASSIDGHLGLIPHLPPVNNAAWTFVYRCLCRYMLSVLLGLSVGVELLDHVVTLHLIA